MTAATSTVQVGQQSPTGQVPHVFGDQTTVDARAARLGSLIDPGFLAECGWDAAGRIMAPPSEHPMLGWQEPMSQCLADTGCAVPGCQRHAGSHGLCRSHRRGQKLRGLSVDDYAAAPTRHALARFGPCQVAACPRDRCGGLVDFCEAHQSRWLREHRADPGLDQRLWSATTSPIVVTGQLSLAGMPPLVTTQVLYGLQQRTRSGVRTRIEMLRPVVEELRRRRAGAVDGLAAAPPATMGRDSGLS